MTSRSASTRLPVTVITGFLGAGKTTLLRELLLNSGQKLAVLVNEFGEVGIDGELLRSCGFCPEEELEGRLVELANGCLCCTVQDDFLPTMTTLLERSHDLDGIIVETSGLALPLPLVEAFQWPEIRSRTRVNGVVTVVDGEALAGGHVVADLQALEAQRQADPSLDHLDDIEGLFNDQLQAADLVLISRADRLEAGELEAVRRRLQQQLRPGTVLLAMERGQIEPVVVLGLDGANTADDATDNAASHGHGHHSEHSHGVEHSDEPEHSHGHEHSHGSEGSKDPAHGHHDHHHVPMQSVALRLEGHYNRTRLEAALQEQIRQQVLIRLKGQLQQPDRAHPLQIQAVGPRLECWYERQQATENGQNLTPAVAGLQLVALGLQVNAQVLEQALATALEP